MIKAIFECPECGAKTEIRFKTGQKPKSPNCDKCNKEMNRIFGKVQLGDVVSDEMLDLGQTMLYK